MVPAPPASRARRLAAALRDRLPLPLTLLTILVLTTTPILLLLRWPRPQARGLERLLPVASLLQSFPADPGRPVPALWQQRLGSAAAAGAWRAQRRLWWQFWGRHGDAGAFLALPASQLPQRPATAIELDDLVVVAPDPLSRQLLLEQLRLQQRPPRGLEQRCLERLQVPQGVYWSAVALGTMAGPLAPLLEGVQQGCLSLSLIPTGLAWTGEAAAVPGLLAPPPPAAGAPTQAPQLPGDGPLLTIEGASLATLLQGLTSRGFIREPLERRYGVQAAQLGALGRAPFQLHLRPQAEGPFKASLELLIQVGAQRQRWAALLKRLGEALLAQGLEPAPGPAAAAEQTLLPNATWQRLDGTVVGGWRWQLPEGAASDPQLLFFLGPQPAQASASSAAASAAAAALGSGGLRLSMRPAALQQRGLLPAELPDPVRRADALALQLRGGGGRTPEEAISRVTGSLHLRR